MANASTPKPHQAEEAAKKGPECALKNRLLFHVSHKLLDENKLMAYHQKLSDTNEDQLSLAAIHYLRSHFQEVSSFSRQTPRAKKGACKCYCLVNNRTRSVNRTGVSHTSRPEVEELFQRGLIFASQRADTQTLFTPLLFVCTAVTMGRERRARVHSSC